jgi:hypothetical protein
VACASLTPQAHHSLSGAYDTTRRIPLEGVVVEFHLVRPHPFLVIDVEGGAGVVERWRGELDNLHELTAIGVTAGTFTLGDRIVMSGSPARRPPQGLYIWRLDRPADGFWYEQVGASPSIGSTLRR